MTRRQNEYGSGGVPRRGPGRGVAVLDAIRVAWEWLCAEPHPVTVAGTQIEGVADGPIPLGELRSLMLDPATPREVRDAVWAYLVTRARLDGSTWTVACAGMGLPMLAAAYRDCLARCAMARGGGSGAVDRDDVASAVVTGFVAAVATVDIARPGIVSSLRWAALRSGLAAVREVLDAPAARPLDWLLADAPPDTSTGTRVMPGVGSGVVDAGSAARGAHPDLVLADAVTDGVITAEEAELIGETRLQRVGLAAVATRSGRTVGAVTMRRLRAELRLVDHLRERDADPHDDDSENAETGTGTRRAPGAPRRDRPRSRVPEAATRPAASGPSGSVGGSDGPSHRVCGPGGSPPRRRTHGRRGAGSPTGGDESPSVSGPRRRRTRGARRGGSGQAPR